MRLPQIQIQSTPARIGIITESSHFDIKQPNPQISVNTTPAVIDIQIEQPRVMIDQSRTWDALTGGKPVTFWKRIYSSYEQCHVNYIRRKTSEYDQIGDPLAGGNAVAEVARRSMFREGLKLHVYGHASPRNVQFDAQISKPVINVKAGEVNVNAIVGKPQIDFTRGNVQVYLKQRASVHIVPPVINLAL